MNINISIFNRYAIIISSYESIDDVIYVCIIDKLLIEIKNIEIVANMLMKTQLKSSLCNSECVINEYFEF